MKKFSLLMCCVILPLFVNAQEIKKQKEVGLVFSNLNNFGLAFKTGTNKSMWRFSTVMLSGDKSNDAYDSTKFYRKNVGLNMRFGKEFRKPIGEKLELVIGGDIIVGFSYSNYDRDDISTYNYDYSSERILYKEGIDFVLGLNYIINKHLLIGAELLPTVSYYFGEETTKEYENSIKNDLSGFQFGLSNSSATLNLAYRF